MKAALTGAKKVNINHRSKTTELGKRAEQKNPEDAKVCKIVTIHKQGRHTILNPSNALEYCTDI